MEVSDFLRQIQAEIRSEITDRIDKLPYPYPEMIFAEVVMQHMADIGMTIDPEVCHYSAKVGNANLKLSGFSFSDDSDQLDLFVSLYANTDEITTIPDSETKTAAEQCLRFLAKCATGTLARTMDESNDAYALAARIQNHYPYIDQIRIYVITDRIAKSKYFKSREISGKLIRLEVMDIERLHRHWAEGKPRDEIIVDFKSVAGGPLPCIHVPGDDSEYAYALTVFPGEALRYVYEKYGARLLEANVRSFLGNSVNKVNKGVRDTLKNDPDRFLAYNNGIVVVADELRIENLPDGGIGISSLKGMQIVNGGQTTASIYFTHKKEKNPPIDLSRVRIPAKIIVLIQTDTTMEEEMISNISKYANSQSSVKLSDLSANNPFHVEIENLSLSTYCPDGVNRWFYERASGSYNVMLARNGTTPAKLRELKATLHTSRKISKTDLAKYLHAWDEKPHLVSLGAQKNFNHFMREIKDEETNLVLPDVSVYKDIIAKAIIYKSAHKLILPLFPAFQANVTAYTVSLIANRLGHLINLNDIWTCQMIPTELSEQIKTWAAEVHAVLHRTASGRMISEWAKKIECWDEVRLDGSYSDANDPYCHYLNE